MACIRVRRGKYVLDYRDKWGVRKVPAYPLTPEGLAAAEADKARLVLGDPPDSGPNITLGDYITHCWLPVIVKRVDPLTARSYEINARCHITHVLKRARLRDVGRPQLKRLLSTVGAEHQLSESTVAKIANVLRSIFDCAVDDGLIQGNPAAGLRLALGIVEHKAEDVLAMEAGQLETFLAVARVHAPEHFMEFALLAYAGLRRGELRGLQVDDLDLEARTLHLQRQVTDDGRVTALKGRRGKKRPRMVDMADALVDLLVPYLASRREYAMRTGARGPWLLYPDWPAAPSSRHARTAYNRMSKAMIRVLKLARIAQPFRPHSLRHTYATVLLSRGEDLLYVSRQLGHASIAITADRYGHSARVRPKAGGANLLTREQG